MAKIPSSEIWPVVHAERAALIVDLETLTASHPATTVDRLRAVCTSSDTPPAALATRLVEAFAQGEDIRRLLGITGDYPPAQVAVALAYQTKTGVCRRQCRGLLRLSGRDDAEPGRRAPPSGIPLDVDSA